VFVRFSADDGSEAGLDIINLADETGPIFTRISCPVQGPDIGTTGQSAIVQSGSHAVQIYRCYILNSHDQTASVDSVHAMQDDEAMSKAAEKIQRTTVYPIVEVWQGGD
jgi:hypothetical protein